MRAKDMVFFPMIPNELHYVAGIILSTEADASRHVRDFLLSGAQRASITVKLSSVCTG